MVWTKKTDTPYPINRDCAIPDEANGRFWMIGGSTNNYRSRSKSEVYIYRVSSDEWSLHSHLPFNEYDSACTMVTDRNGDRGLLVVRGYSDDVYYYNISDSSSSWSRIGSLFGSSYQYYMKIVFLHKYSIFMLGSYFSRKGNSLWNFLEYNHQTGNFDYGFHFLQNEMNFGDWTTVKRNRYNRAINNCLATRLYAAVGWGGKDFEEGWSVLLRHRQSSGTEHPPRTCHGQIPDLTPGRSHPGITAVDYLLMVCGGTNSNGTVLSSCSVLNTNSDNLRWKVLDDMPVARHFFSFITYGGMAFAIAGSNGVERIQQVDGWTEGEGWIKLADYPTKVQKACAVADEGYDRLFSLGGSASENTATKKVYMYRVSQNEWTPFGNLYYATSNHACGIVRRRSGLYGSTLHGVLHSGAAMHGRTN